jgi:predicted acylesterase/phospholipase RssA
MFSTDEWEDLIKWFTNGDLTFEEAYQRTGRTFCITLSSTSKKASPVLLNHLSAPNVLIASAVIASAAVPGFIPPVRLKYKDSKGMIRNYGKKGESFWDGSIQSDVSFLLLLTYSLHREACAMHRSCTESFLFTTWCAVALS